MTTVNQSILAINNLSQRILPATGNASHLKQEKAPEDGAPAQASNMRRFGEPGIRVRTVSGLQAYQTIAAIDTQSIQQQIFRIDLLI